MSSPRVLVVATEPTESASIDCLSPCYDVETAAPGADLSERSVDVIVLEGDHDWQAAGIPTSVLTDDQEPPHLVLRRRTKPPEELHESESVCVLREPVTNPDLVGAVERFVESTAEHSVDKHPFDLRGASVRQEDTPRQEPAHTTPGKDDQTLEQLVTASPAAIVTLDEAGTVDIWNPSAETLFGWEAAEVVGEEPPIFSREHESALAAVREEVATGSVVTDVTQECLTALGTTIDVSLSATPLFDEAGRPAGTMFVMMDITQRQQREQRLSVLSRILRHNIRNELTVVMGRCEILRETVDGDQASHIDPMIESVNDLLRLSRKAQSVQEALENVPESITVRDIEPIVETVITDATEIFEDATVECSMQTTNTNVLAGEGLEMAIWQLVENAVEYNDSESPVVELTVDSERTTTGIWTRISVADNGPGIPEMEIETIQREREDALIHGSGVGLWSVRWVVQQSGGTVSFDESELGGSRVTIRFPRGRQRN